MPGATLLHVLAPPTHPGGQATHRSTGSTATTGWVPVTELELPVLSGGCRRQSSGEVRAWGEALGCTEAEARAPRGPARGLPHRPGPDWVSGAGDALWQEGLEPTGLCPSSDLSDRERQFKACRSSDKIR